MPIDLSCTRPPPRVPARRAARGPRCKPPAPTADRLGAPSRASGRGASPCPGPTEPRPRHPTFANAYLQDGRRSKAPTPHASFTSQPQQLARLRRHAPSSESLWTTLGRSMTTKAITPRAAPSCATSLCHQVHVLCKKSALSLLAHP